MLPSGFHCRQHDKKSSRANPDFSIDSKLHWQATEIDRDR
jgi:hypothetical protein